MVSKIASFGCLSLSVSATTVILIKDSRINIVILNIL
jgi:hypothetical protein